MRLFKSIIAFVFPLVFAAALALAQDSGQEGKWIQLFNGKDLTGWKVKITGHDLGDNFGNTFHVEDGVMKVYYEAYDRFGDRFGHIFYEQPFSNYVIRVEYRFTSEQCAEGPSWALRNSGIMLHCQNPEGMRVEQRFPVCIEVQLLGGDGANERSTANLCTPGTNVVLNGQLWTQHCTNSTSKTYHGDQWVTVEVEVRGNRLIRHIIDGKTVLEYGQPQLDDTDEDARRLLKSGSALMLSGGYISLQSESHPVEFRKVELKKLEE